MKHLNFLKLDRKNFDYRKLVGEQASDITLRLKKLKKKVYNLGVGDPQYRIPKKNNCIIIPSQKTGKDKPT